MSRLFFILVSMVVANIACADGYCTHAPWTANKCQHEDRWSCELEGLSSCRWITQEAKGSCKPAPGTSFKCRHADRWSCEMQGVSVCIWSPGVTHGDAARAEAQPLTRTN